MHTAGGFFPSAQGRENSVRRRKNWRDRPTIDRKLEICRRRPDFRYRDYLWRPPSDRALAARESRAAHCKNASETRMISVRRQCYNCVTTPRGLIEIRASIQVRLNDSQTHLCRKRHDLGRVTTMAKLSRSKGSRLDRHRRRETQAA